MNLRLQRRTAGQILLAIEQHDRGRHHGSGKPWSEP